LKNATCSITTITIMILNAECHIFIAKINVIMSSVIMPSVVMLSVMALN